MRKQVRLSQNVAGPQGEEAELEPRAGACHPACPRPLGGHRSPWAAAVVQLRMPALSSQQGARFKSWSPHFPSHSQLMLLGLGLGVMAFGELHLSSSLSPFQRKETAVSQQNVFQKKALLGREKYTAVTQHMQVVGI